MVLDSPAASAISQPEMNSVTRANPTKLRLFAGKSSLREMREWLQGWISMLALN